ncbi:HutD family protein [Dokdonella sp.]|uniref:HutD/Ves family protein n=1 Tax=Dokdonella sp. TaxID=2291710 RepID=UPI00352704CE
MRLLRPSDYRRTRWKNDGGWTTEIASCEDNCNQTDFVWRVSIAEIESDGPFSSFPGVRRDLLMLAGNGMELDINEQAPRRLDKRFEHVRFEGEDSVHCRLLAGPTRDFNVMTRRDSATAEVHARPINGTMLAFSEAGSTWLVHVFAGQITARTGHQAIEAGANATLIIESVSDRRERIVLEGGGELVLVRFNTLECKPAE